MITACKSYITDSGYETIWTQEQNAVLKKLDDCIKLNEEYQVNTRLLCHEFLTKSYSFCSIVQKIKAHHAINGYNVNTHMYAPLVGIVKSECSD